MGWGRVFWGLSVFVFLGASGLVIEDRDEKSILTCILDMF